MSELQDATAFRASAREWLAANVPPAEHVTGDAQVQRSKRFAKAMYDAGFSGLQVATEYGGRGLSATEQQIWREEASRLPVPMAIYDIGLGMCGPIILALGTEEQRTRYIRPILEGVELWCQLFSEPAAGSDVASLRTKAVRDGDEFVVSGQKVWATGAHYCDFGIVLARTNPGVPKHRGLTMMIIDMHAAGVTVRPLREMTGEANFNEVFLDEVRVPVSQVIGEIDKGWDAARLLLSFERLAVSGGGAAIEGAASGPISFAALRALAIEAGTITAAGAQEDLVRLFLTERSISAFNEQLTREANAGIDPGARGSIGKLLKARREVWAATLTSKLGGPSMMFDAGASPSRRRFTLRSFALAAGGGTNEIQLSIIGERVLGLPREPADDLKIPFNEMDARRGDVER